MGLMNFDDLLKNALNDQKDPPMELNDKLRKKLSDMPQKNAKKRNYIGITAGSAVAAALILAVALGSDIGFKDRFSVMPGNSPKEQQKIIKSPEETETAEPEAVITQREQKEEAPNNSISNIPPISGKRETPIKETKKDRDISSEPAPETREGAAEGITGYALNAPPTEEKENEAPPPVIAEESTDRPDQVDVDTDALMYSVQADTEGETEEENTEYVPMAENAEEEKEQNSGRPVLGAMAKSASGGGSVGAYRKEKNICVEFSDYPDPNYEISKRVKEKTGKDVAISGLEEYFVSQTGEISVEIDGEMINIGKP